MYSAISCNLAATWPGNLNTFNLSPKVAKTSLMAEFSSEDSFQPLSTKETSNLTSHKWLDNSRQSLLDLCFLFYIPCPHRGLQFPSIVLKHNEIGSKCIQNLRNVLLQHAIRIFFKRGNCKAREHYQIQASICVNRSDTRERGEHTLNNQTIQISPG